MSSDRPIRVDFVIDLFVKVNLTIAVIVFLLLFRMGDVEVFHVLLIQASEVCTDEYNREHVTPWMQLNSDLKIGNLENSLGDMSAIRLTVDEPEDLLVVRSVVEYFADRPDFSVANLKDLYEQNNALFSPNEGFTRNSGHSLVVAKALAASG